jgi:hypothetical protein
MAQASAFAMEKWALAWVGRDVGHAAADDADGHFDGREAGAPPRSTNGVGVNVAENIECAVYAEDGEDGETWVCQW